MRRSWTLSENTIIDKADDVKGAASEHTSDEVDAVKTAGSGILGKFGDIAGDIKDKVRKQCTQLWIRLKRSQVKT